MKKSALVVTALLTTLSAATIVPAAFADSNGTMQTSCNGCKDEKGCKGCNGCKGEKACQGCNGCKGADTCQGN